MYKNKFIQKLFCLFITIIITAFCSFSAFAVDNDGDGYDDVTGEYIGYGDNATTSPEPETQPETEYFPPTTEYVAPETEAPTEYVPDTTEYVEPQTEEKTEAQYTEKAIQSEDKNTDTTEFVAPTVAKTISSKSYSTNYTAGIVSWICVGVGIIVVVAVLISNKVGGNKSARSKI